MPLAASTVTHFSVLERFDVATVVACRLDTGRTHQIRVHLAERAGSPILGDPLYGSGPPAPAVRAPPGPTVCGPGVSPEALCEGSSIGPTLLIPSGLLD